MKINGREIFRNKNKGLRSIIFGMCIATGMFALYHVEKTSKLENRNSVLRSTLDKLEAEADDKFTEQLSE